MSHSSEILSGQRFEFGRNWSKFLSVLNDDRIKEAEKSLVEMLEFEDLRGKSFLDIGSGSGLFSLAARNLGAKVHSFDYDPQSVACALELKRRYYPQDQNWLIQEGNILDIEYVKSLGSFDIVYSWGVLHHTGNMWQALDNAQIPVNSGGRLFIAIYNDQGRTSQRWTKIKQVYCSGLPGKALITGTFIPYYFLRGLAKDILRLRNPTKSYVEYKKSRGMSKFHDQLDWLGGYPFEVAKVEEIFSFYQNHNFLLQKVKTNCGHGNNQFVFKKV